MAKVKVVNNNLDQNLNGTNFNNTPSETIFSFGGFSVTSNFDGRKPIDYSNTLSSFVRPVTLDTMGVSQVQSEIMQQYSVNAVLNLDKSDINTFVRFGSAYEFLRVSVQNIIVQYPGSLFMNSQTTRGGNVTFTNFNYNPVTNISTFTIPTGCTVNMFGLVMNIGNNSTPDNNELKNLNNAYNNYVVWSVTNSTGNSYSVVGFTGYTAGKPNINVMTIGNPFTNVTLIGGTAGVVDFHIKPSNAVFEEFRALLSDYERYIVSTRVTGGTNGFKFTIKDPTLMEDGSIVYSNTSLLWTTSDNYNIDISTPKYRSFLTSLLAIGDKYDAAKTDLIARFLTPDSIKKYDLTEDGKMTKLLRIYGREFDQMRQFIDSLVNINRVTYDKVNNIPDQLIKNLSRTFGWDYFSLVNENELVQSFLTIDNAERNLDTDLMPAEIDIELWRRILINTSYFWKSKGTREAIKAMFLLIGIPEPFINITEYVYTVDGRIDPNTVNLTALDFPSNSFPYDSAGYPAAPLETPDFFFQVSGDTDAGQHYLDVFRKAGFNLKQTVDNKKSWVQAGAITRVDDTTPQYFQADSKLVINTKEIDVALDTARGIEYDVYDYIKSIDFPVNSSGYTLPFSYVNISLGVSASQNTFSLPDSTEGDFEVRYNGILLNAPKTGLTTGITYQADYTVNYSANTFTLAGGNYAHNSGNRRDVIQVTYIHSGSTTHPVTGITVEYIVTRVSANMGGTYIPLPSYPRGDVQVTINGIALTKGTPQFNADYVLDPANSTGGSNNIIIQNPEVISYLAVQPDVQIAYVKVAGSNEVNARSEVVRVDSFNSSKIYFNNSANKYVYKMNYKANNAREIKVLIDGIALEPNKDYTINVQNPYEIFLPTGIRYGTVISIYYLVAISTYFNPIIKNSFGVGDISKLSFLEFIELIQRRLINARNRKTISDFKGGWYPALLRVYVEYLKRANLPVNDPLHSNGYTFENLYSFLSKYNAFFQRFVDQLLPATIIMKNSGLLVRNTVFTKQKFMYKRGVNVIGNQRLPLLKYFGDDGSIFLVDQNINPPVPITATTPTVTTTAITLITMSGATTGGNISSDGGNAVTQRGVAWSTSINPTTADNITSNGTGIGSFTSVIIGLLPSTTYHVRAYAINGIGISYGADLTLTTAALPIVPSITTKASTGVTQTAINGVGGMNINTFASVDFYNMQYAVSAGTPTWFVTTPQGGPLAVDNYTTKIIGLNPDTDYLYRARMTVSGNTYLASNILLAHTQAIPLSLPTVTTDAMNTIGQTSANGGGNVTSDGNAAVTARGIAWGLAPNPTIAGNHTTDGSGTGVFTSSLVGLTSNTTYYVRAYATNSVGTAYGNQVTFTTLVAPVIATLCMTFQNVPFTSPHQRIVANLSQPISGGDICIQEAHVEGFNAGDSGVASATMGVWDTEFGRTCICYPPSLSGSRFGRTDQDNDSSWSTATGYSYSAPAVKINGQLISVCGTVINVGIDSVIVNFPVSCIHL